MEGDNFNDLEKELNNYQTELDEDEYNNVTQESNNQDLEDKKEVVEGNNVNVEDSFSVSNSTSNDNQPDQEIVNQIQFGHRENRVVHINFPKNSTEIAHTIIATGQKDTTLATNRQLRLISGRQYYVPVDCPKDVNSDNFKNIKMFSDISDQIDCRYVKNGYACIIPLTGRLIIHDKQRICILIGE